MALRCWKQQNPFIVQTHWIPTKPTRVTHKQNVIPVSSNRQSTRSHIYNVSNLKEHKKIQSFTLQNEVCDFCLIDKLHKLCLPTRNMKNYNLNLQISLLDGCLTRWCQTFWCLSSNCLSITSNWIESLAQLDLEELVFSPY